MTRMLRHPSAGPTGPVIILEEHIMAWNTPVVEEICLGMEITSYESAEIEF